MLSTSERTTAENTGRANDDGWNLPDEQKYDPSTWEMIKHFFKIAFPVVIQCSFMRLTMLTNTLFAGSLNDVNKLAGIGLAVIISCILCVTVIEGINGALETLASQAFGYG